MGEDALLMSFALSPALTGFGLYLFFRRYGLHKRKTVLRLLAGNLLVFSFLGSVALLAGEIYFRFIYDTTDSFALAKTTQQWFKRHFKYNMNGMRDSLDYRLDQRVGTRRITFVGDSFTAGHGIADVEDRFANRIRSMMPGTEVHVIAYPGADTGVQVEAMSELAQFGYHFDVVVLVYCLNDISDIVPEWQQILERIYESHNSGFVVNNSYLFNWLYFRFFAVQDPDVSDYYAFVRENYEGPVWERQTQRLDNMRSEIQERGGQLFVVTFPFLHSLGPDDDYGAIHEQLGSFWQDRGVPHLDLLSVYESFEPADVVVNRFDAHPNERAHALAAGAIAEFLERHLRK